MTQDGQSIGKLSEKEEFKEKQKETIEHHSSHTAAETSSLMLEKGFIYFFYRPKPELEEAHGLEDVQKLFVVLAPQAHIYKKDEKPVSHKNIKRIIAIPKKFLPEPSRHAKHFGFIDLASENLADIDQELGEKTYTTKTSGERHLKGARPAGEGIYAIVEHHGHTHLAYVLELPHDLGDVQEAFHIHKEGSFVITVKNPNAASSGGWFNAPQKSVHLPSHLQDVFGDKKFSKANPVELLDYTGMQLILIGAAEDVVEELGKTGEEIEELEKMDAKRLSDDKLFQELHMTKKEHPPEPLLTGEWK